MYQRQCPYYESSVTKNIVFCTKRFSQKGSPAFSDDIEAWKCGPVVPNVYFYFCGFGAMLIQISRDAVPNLSTDKNIINSIVEAKRSLAPWEAVKETREITGAWSKVYDNGKGSQRIIPAGLIKKMD